MLKGTGSCYAPYFTGENAYGKDINCEVGDKPRKLECLLSKNDMLNRRSLI